MGLMCLIQSTTWLFYWHSASYIELYPFQTPILLLHSLINAVVGALCIALGVDLNRFPSSRRIILELGLILFLRAGSSLMIALLPDVFRGMISTDVLFYGAKLAFTLSLMYLAYSLLRSVALHSRNTFFAIGLASLAVLIYSGQYEFLLSIFYLDVPFNPFWLSYVLYSLSLIITFIIFAVAGWRNISLPGFRDTRLFSVLQAAVLFYGAGWLLMAVNEDIVHYQFLVQASSVYLGTPLYAVVTLLWPLLDFVFAASIIVAGLTMRGVQVKAVENVTGFTG